MGRQTGRHTDIETLLCIESRWHNSPNLGVYMDADLKDIVGCQCHRTSETIEDLWSVLSCWSKGGPEKGCIAKPGLGVAEDRRLGRANWRQGPLLPSNLDSFTIYIYMCV